MSRRYIFVGLSAVIALAGVSFFSGCGGGGSAPSNTGGTLTGSAAIGGSAVSRVGRASIANLQNMFQLIRRTRGRTHGRQGLDLDEELGLYYRLHLGSTGAEVDLFEDS